MKRSALFFTLARVPVDFLLLIAAATAAYFLRVHPVLADYRPVLFALDFATYLTFVLPVACLWIVVFAFAGLYSTRRLALSQEFRQVMYASSTSLALVFAALFLSRVVFDSRFIALASWVFAIVFLAIGRMILTLTERFLYRFGIGERHIMLIGNTKTAQTLTEYFASQPQIGVRVVSHLDQLPTDLVPRLQQLKNAIGLDEVWLVDPRTPLEALQDIQLFCDTEHIAFHYSADLFGTALERSTIHFFSGIPMIEIHKTPLEGWGAIYKRLFDVVGSIILILLSLPLQLLIAIALFIEQPGRVLFSRLPDGRKAMRIGVHGHPFHYFKFRSMVRDAHNKRFDPAFMKEHGNLREGTPLFKLKNDPRVTRVGRFIRRYSLDELPEFFLVLLGRMSLVGPRPHLPEEVNQYKPYQRKVLTVKPGITGMAQVSGRADLDFDEEVRLDMFYIEHWNPWLDFVILCKTILVVFFKKGAY